MSEHGPLDVAPLRVSDSVVAAVRTASVTDIWLRGADDELKYRAELLHRGWAGDMVRRSGTR